MEAHVEELGPVDIVVIAFPAGAPMTGEAVPMLLDLVDLLIELLHGIADRFARDFLHRLLGFFRQLLRGLFCRVAADQAGKEHRYA